MRDPLAEWLLAEVMEWSQEDVARERPILQAMAAYKYDEYQQFSPGMRFVESLALWLSQYKTTLEKNIAYEFVKDKLVFISTAETSHLASMAYPDFIRPILLRKAAVEAGLNSWQIAKIAESIPFKVLQRRCLFLGLSDGARIDIFRRYNNLDLSHEQIYPTYELSPGRVDALLAKLTKDLTYLLGHAPSEEVKSFQNIVLLDDFSASGISYLNKDQEQETYSGKIAKFYSSVIDRESEVSKLIDVNNAEIFVVLYIATRQALEHLNNIMDEMWAPTGSRSSVIVVHPLSDNIKLKPGTAGSIEQLIQEYYDETIQNEHTDKGGTDLRYGFAGCGLPVVLPHNTPNNSLSLIWAQTENVRALFPRVNRHK